MKLKIERYSIKLFPENEIEEAYIEEVLELYKDQDTGTVKRVDASNLLSIAYLEIRQTKGEVTSDQDRLEQLMEKAEKNEDKLDKLREDVLILKTKAWLFGILGGVIVTALSQFIIRALNK